MGDHKGVLLEDGAARSAWRQADPDERDALVVAAGTANPAFRRAPERCLVDMLDLQFYPQGRLFRVTTRDIPGSAQWYVLLPQETVPLAEGADAIMHCNAIAPLTLNEAMIFDYVRFHYFFAAACRVFEARIKRSAVGYTGKIWLYENRNFFEVDVNVSTRGLVAELERVQIPDIPDFVPEAFTL
jgi:hypothetical protein